MTVSRVMNTVAYHLVRPGKLVSLFLDVGIGATGAPGTLTYKPCNQGISGITRNSAGKYTINFGSPISLSPFTSTDKYTQLMNADFTLINATIPAAQYGMVVLADHSSSGSIVVQFVAATSSGDTTPAATDLPNGSTLLMRIDLFVQ